MSKIIVTKKGVEKILKGLNITKAKGPDNIHPRVLKELASELSEVMAHFFQQSIDMGSIPSEWKKVNTCPLFKKNDRSIPSNYRAGRCHSRAFYVNFWNISFAQI